MRKLQITRKSPTKDKLKELYRNEKDIRLKERYHAIYLMHEFENACEVANLLGREKTTILTWIKAFNQHGLEGLLRRSPPGRNSRLSKEQMEKLKGGILKNPCELNYNFSNWEGKSIAFHILKKFGVQLGVRAVQKLLHKLGFSLQRPRHKLKKADPKAQEEFRHQLKKKMGTLGPNDVLLFEDECSVKYSPSLTRCWALKGNQPEIFTFGGRQKQNLIGVLDPLKGKGFGQFIETLKAPQFQEFLEDVINLYKEKEKIVIVLDNAKAHHTKALKPFLEGEAVKDKLELLFLPPYSPNLNLIERFWKFMRKKVTHNTFFSTFQKFLDVLQRFFNIFKLPSMEIPSLCRIS
ncbi:MAG: IS630 family transposase [Promethearchaeota archaeon]